MPPTLNSFSEFAPDDLSSEPSDAQVQAFFRRFLPDFYFVNTSLSRMRRHLELLKKLPAEPLQLDFHHTPSSRSTELVLCARDEVQPGLLAKVAGTLTALRVNVHTAWIHTLDDPHKAGTGRVILDTLILSESYFRRTRPLSSRTRKMVADTLTDVLDGRADVDFLVSRHARSSAALEVFDLSAHEVGAWTLLKLRASDDPGFLFRVARTLSRLELNIAHAQINTFETAADDVFFVTRNGAPIPETEVAGILERLRRELSV